MVEERIKERADEAWDKVKGKTNEVVGAARGDRSQELRGKAQTVKGNLKGGLNDVKDEMRDES